MIKKILSALLLLFAFFVITCVLTYPAVTYFTTDLIGDGGDNYQFFSWQQITYHNIASGQWPFADTSVWRYPQGFPFARGVDSYLFLLLGIGINSIVNDPIITFNTAVFVLFIANAYCSYLFFTKISNSRLLGFLGALIYGFSFHSLARNGSHPNLLFTGGFPLLAYSLVRIRNDLNKVPGIMIGGLSVLLIGLGSFQHMLMLVGTLPFILLFTWTFLREELINLWYILKAHYKAVATSALIFGGLLLAACFPYLSAIVTGSFARKSTAFEDLFFWSPSLLDYIRPAQYFHVWFVDLFTKSDRISIDFSVYLGIIELILFMHVLFARITKRLKWFLLSLVAVFFVFSLGVKNPDTGLLLPYAGLSFVFPYWGIPEAGRWYTIFYFFMTTGIVLYLASLPRFTKTHIAMLIGLGMVLLIERLPGTYYQSSLAFTQYPYIDVVRQTQGSAVLDLPIDMTASPIGNWNNVLPFYYQKNIVGGYTHYSLDNPETLAFVNNSGAWRFICDTGDSKKFLEDKQGLRTTPLDTKQFIDDLRTSDIKTIVVHKDFQLYFDYCRNVVKEVTTLLPRTYTITPTTGITMLETRRFYDDKINYTLYFPQGGTFTIEHFQYAYPEKSEQPLQIMLNNEPIATETWTNTDSFEWERWVRSTYTKDEEGNLATITIPAGSTMKIHGDEQIAAEGFLNIWYSFTSASGSATIAAPETGLNKIYEDDKTEVWTLR